MLTESLKEGGYNYTQPMDNISRPNNNARKLTHICREWDLLLLNNLVTPTCQYHGSLTYRQRNNWISELDICLTSLPTIKNLSSPAFNTDTKMPSNHAPISVTLNTGDYRSQDLTETLLQASSPHHTTSQTCHKATKCKRPVRFREMNCPNFTQNIQQAELPTFQGNLDLWTNAVCDVIYENVNNSKKMACDKKSQEQSQDRWTKLIETNDSRDLWKAINWSGDIAKKQENERPTDEQFKQHFEELLNQPDIDK